MGPKRFVWDNGNTNKNLKHNVTDQEGEEVFFDPELKVYYDKGHSIIEDRYYALGKTLKGRTLFVVFTLRNERLRIISARAANKKERDAYEKPKNNSRV